MNRYFIFIESNTSGTGYEYIRRAASKYRVLFITADPGRYTLPVDVSFELAVTDTKDLGAVVRVCSEAAKKSGLVGIMSSSEYYVEIAAAAAAVFGLPGNSSVAVAQARNKQYQRQAMQECGLACPRYRTLLTEQDAADIDDFPVIIKPTAGSGSSGVHLCLTPEVARAHASALFAEFGRPLLAEEYIVGDEYSAEVIGMTIIGFTKKHLGELPFFVETGHDFPCVLPDDLANKAEEAILKLCRALGLEFGPKHVEFRIRGNNVYIIEVNPRLAGGHIPTVMEYALGRNILDTEISLYAGETTEVLKAVPGETRETSIRFLIPETEGCLCAFDTKLPRAEFGNILDVQMYRTPGYPFRPCGDFRDRVGHVIFTCSGNETAILDFVRCHLRTA